MKVGLIHVSVWSDQIKFRLRTAYCDILRWYIKRSVAQFIIYRYEL